MTAPTAALIWLLVGLIPLSLGGMALLESWLYFRGQTPITTYARNWSNRHAWAAVAIGLALVAGSAVGVTHFILDR